MMAANTPPVAEVRLRDTVDADLPVFFAQHQDEGALQMAAFTPPDPTDETALIAHWQKLIRDPAVVLNTILADDRIAGSLVFFEMFDQQQVGYFLGREFWGRGVATRALTLFLSLIPVRPLYARTAFDNLGSQRVLAKCGFVEIGRDTSYANARGAEIEEIIFRLV
ncbi:MAG TPA: GNAT family N-acetyltransferase [Candidatus Limnocylindrales bacterium]|nr:GNAT family N-acetyltransferase [Candidatus Limnocylindrales bacterium]